MKKWNAKMSEKSNTICIALDAIMAIGIFFLYSFSAFLALMLLMLTVFLNIAWYFYNDEKKKKAQLQEEKKWQALFACIAQKKMTKESLLEEDLPLSVRIFFERALSQSLSIEDYQKVLDNHLPMIYHQTFISLYYFFEEGSKEEFQECYILFQKEITTTRMQKELAKQKHVQSVPIFLLIGFIGLLFLFLFPYFREIVYA